MPTALASTANNRNDHVRPARLMPPTAATRARSARRAGSVLLERPVGAARPVLLLPDRYRFPSACRCRTRAASNATSRCGDDTTTATDGSESCSSPTRCSSATRSTSGQRRRISATISPIARDAPAPRRPRTSSPRTPVASLGVIAHDADEASRPRPNAAWSPTTCSASTGSASSVSATQSHASVGGGSTATVYGTSPGSPPGPPDRAAVAAVANDERRRYTRSRWVTAARRVPGATSATTSPARSRSKTTGPISAAGRSRIRSIACGCTRASSRRFVAGIGDPRAKPVWTTTLVAGAAGAILTLAVLGAVGALGGRPTTPPTRNACPRARRSRRAKASRSRSRTRSSRSARTSNRHAARLGCVRPSRPARSSRATGSSGTRPRST